MWFGKKTHQAPLNLATQPGYCAAVQLAAEPYPGKPRLLAVRVETSTLPSLEKLDFLAKQLKIKRTPLHLLLENSEYQFLQTDIPSVPKEELKTAIRWQIKDLLRSNLENTTLDVAAPSDQHGSRRPSGFVVAAENKLLQERMLQFRAYNSEVTVIDIPEMAQRNLADQVEENGRATAVLSITPSGCLLTASRNGVLYFTRNFELSTLTLAAAASVRSDQFDRLLLELQRSIDVLEHQFSYLSVSALWLSPFAHAEELLGLLIEHLYLPVRIMNLAEIFDSSHCPLPENADLQAALFHVLGLSLRDREVRP